MASKIDICNLSLTKLGADRIMAMDEDTEVAKKMVAVYNLILDEVLSAHPWNFAIKRVAMALSNDSPAFGYSYQHQIPSDCMRVLGIYNGTDESDAIEDYKKEGDVILSEEDTLYIRYIARIADSTKYSPHFITTFSTRLAAELAYPLANSGALAETMLKLYQTLLSQAKGVDAQESGKTETMGQDQWLDGRV